MTKRHPATPLIAIQARSSLQNDAVCLFFRLMIMNRENLSWMAAVALLSILVTVSHVLPHIYSCAFPNFHHARLLMFIL
jgi:hypothetical protein